MRRRLEADGVFEHREIIFLSHSMGGLVTRAFLLKYRHYTSQVRFLYFLSTPTEGSPSAALAALASRNPQFRNMYPMQADSYLADLQRDWLAAHLPIQSFCAYEGLDTFGIRIVDQRSATNLCTEPLDPILEDHIGIAKPASGEVDSYIAFKNAFRSTRKDTVLLPVPSAELLSLVSYFEDKGTRILAQLDAAIADMAEKAPMNDRFARSKVLAERKRAAFIDVFARHITAIKAGQLTLAAVFETEANEILMGKRVAYASDPGFFEFVPTIPYAGAHTNSQGKVSEYAQIMLDRSLTTQARQAAAVQIIRNCDGSDDCVVAAATILTSTDMQYIHWEAAQVKICRAQGNKALALPFILRVFSDRHTYSDWRLWTFSMDIGGCIGKPAETIVPFVVDVIERTELVAGESYNTPYIKEQAVSALGNIGEGARSSVTMLQKLAAGKDKTLADLARRAREKIESDEK